MRLASRLTDKKALVITLCWVAALAATGTTDALLFLAPALLIAIPLLGGHYLGEESIVALGSKRARPSRPAISLSRLGPPVPARWLPRGASLIAFALAKRPPPAGLLTQN